VQYTVKIQVGLIEGDLWNDHKVLLEAIKGDEVMPCNSIFFTGTKEEIMKSLRTYFDGIISFFNEEDNGTRQQVPS
jgi:hypothetical protein